MAILGGAICRMPVLSLARQVVLLQILASLDWHKNRNVNSSCDLLVTVLADNWTNVMTQQARKKVREMQLVSVFALSDSCERKS